MLLFNTMTITYFFINNNDRFSAFIIVIGRNTRNPVAGRSESFVQECIVCGKIFFTTQLSKIFS